MKIILITLIFFCCNMAKAEFFQDISSIIDSNKERLSYGVSVTDFNKDGNY